MGGGVGGENIIKIFIIINIATIFLFPEQQFEQALQKCARSFIFGKMFRSSKNIKYLSAAGHTVKLSTWRLSRDIQVFVTPSS